MGQQARSRQREGRRADRETGTGEQTDRQGLDVGWEVRQAKGQQQEVRQVDQETGTEEQTDRQGLDGRHEVRQARVR